MGVLVSCAVVARSQPSTVFRVRSLLILCLALSDMYNNETKETTLYYLFGRVKSLFFFYVEVRFGTREDGTSRCVRIIINDMTWLD